MNNARGSMQWLGLLLLAAILLQTIAVAVSFIYFSNVLSTMKETFSKSTIACMMRTNLRNARGIDLEGGHNDPCWQITQQLHDLIQKTMSNRFEKELSSAVKGEVSRVLPSLTDDQVSSPHPEIAAHLTGASLRDLDEPHSPASGNVRGQKIPVWESTRGLAFLHSMELRNGELVVPQAGLYYVYSQTYFRHSAEEEEEEVVSDESENTVRGRQMLQYIYKKVGSYAAPILLMKNARTTCWSRDAEYGLYSIYQAGIVQLGAGDRLFVSVSNISTVDMDENSSFFGAFLVSGFTK